MLVLHHSRVGSLLSALSLGVPSSRTQPATPAMLSGRTLTLGTSFIFKLQGLRRDRRTGEPSINGAPFSRLAVTPLQREPNSGRCLECPQPLVQRSKASERPWLTFLCSLEGCGQTSWSPSSRREPRTLRRKNSNRQGRECVAGNSTQSKAAALPHPRKGENSPTPSLGCDPAKVPRASLEAGEAAQGCALGQGRGQIWDQTLYHSPAGFLGQDV